MDLRFGVEDEAFRSEVRAWLDAHLTGDFADARGLGGSGREHEGFEVRLAWERLLGTAGWVGLGWPTEHGGRGATLAQQVVFAEEYSRAQAPARINHFGEQLLGPTLIAFGNESQQRRFLPPILAGQELWCQGYSEPGAGSDLANVGTRAVRDGDEWVITGQKVWTSLAHWADWCFVLCRTDPDAPRHRGLSYILCPMRQRGIEIRPIVQLTGSSEFNEVFFDGARAPGANVVGEVGGGWRVAMGTLGFERGVATVAQQVGFERELAKVIELAGEGGRLRDPAFRQRVVRAWIGLRLLRYNALRTLSAGDGAAPGPEASIAKLAWASWHRALGELAIDVQGPWGQVGTTDGDRRQDANGGSRATGEELGLSDLQRMFLFSRADTIYGGSNQIQRNVIGERALGLPREPAVGL
ncbi:MAG: acyl-CoA dehydrogenase family protein [Acidimicrobiales bacterium]